MFASCNINTMHTLIIMKKVIYLILFSLIANLAIHALSLIHI